MSSRVTRSATKLAAESSSAAANPASSSATHPPPKTRKRKTHPDREPSPDTILDTDTPTSSRQAKKQKLASELSTPTFPKSRRRGGHQSVTMAKPGYVNFRIGQEQTWYSYWAVPWQVILGRRINPHPQNQTHQGEDRVEARSPLKVRLIDHMLYQSRH